MRLLLFTLLVTALTAQAQQLQKRKAPPAFNKTNLANAQFLEKQWWLGLKTGIALSGADVQQPYTALSPVNYTAAAKAYNNYAHPAFAAQLEAAFSFRSFTIALQPGYRNARLDYRTQYVWTDYENADNRLELYRQQRQRIEYVDFPLLIRYAFTHSRLRPYLQAGAYYALLIQATTTVRAEGTDYASGGRNTFSQPAVSLGSTELFAPRHYGLLAGLGASYHSGKVNFTLDIQYRKGMSLANSTDNRYANTRLNSFGEIMDDVHINSLLITAGALFPLKFLSKSFQSVIPR